MRYAPGHKERTRAKILDAAGKIFRLRGYQAAGVDEVMQEAGLTAGGFYAHFRSKETLLAEAIASVAKELKERSQASLKGLAGRAWLTAFVARYLSPAHRRASDQGCPLAALLSEVSRSGDPVKEQFEAVLHDLVARMTSEMGEELSTDRALAIAALCVGGLGLARSVRDEEFADRILLACRDMAEAAMPQSSVHESGASHGTDRL